jgi:hypothetical protein
MEGTDIKVQYSGAIRHLGALALLSSIGCLMLSINQLIGFGMKNTYLGNTYLIIDMITFPLLMLGLISVFIFSLNYNLGKFGLVSFVIAFVGTCLVIGDVWFEIFVTPFLEEDTYINSVGAPPLSMMVGAVLTFFTFSIGWILFGISCYKLKMFPKWLSILLIVGAILGQKVLNVPYIIVLSISMMIITFMIYKEYNKQSIYATQEAG